MTDCDAIIKGREDTHEAGLGGAFEMRTCVIHIGMHKTGTTSIQKSLQKFSDAKFYYADLCGASNHSVAMFSLFSRTPERHHSHSGIGTDPNSMKAYLKAAARDLDKSIRAAGDRTLIISGEDIGKLQVEDLRRMHDRLKRDYDDIRIIGYVRPPMSFITSMFQQMVRSGGRSRFDLHQIHPRYRTRLKKFDAVFGRDRVTFKLFDRRRLAGGDAVVDFCSTLGLDFPRDRIVSGNESWSHQSVCLIFQHNRYCAANGIPPMKSSEAKSVLALLPPLGQDKFHLSPALLQEMISAHREDVAWMEARLGVSLSEAVDDARADDIASESDLLRPVPGAHEALLAATHRLGIGTVGSGLSDAELLEKLRNSLVRGSVLQRIRRACHRMFRRQA